MAWKPKKPKKTKTFTDVERAEDVETMARELIKAHFPMLAEASAGEAPKRRKGGRGNG